MRGRFITLEGGEGGGKSTQAALLCEALRSRGIAVAATREPGGSPGAEEIRSLLVQGEAGRWDATAEALLLFAARRDHLERTIRPALAAGSWVVCDRFTDSTVVYQGVRGLAREVVDELARIAIGGFSPDLTLILDLPAEIGLERARGRGSAEDRFERLGLDFHRRLRDSFLEVARREPARCLVVDATGSVETVHRRIMAGVDARLAGAGAGEGSAGR